MTPTWTQPFTFTLADLFDLRDEDELATASGYSAINGKGHRRVPLLLKVAVRRALSAACG